MIIGQYFYIGSEEAGGWDKKLRPDTPFEKLTRLYIAFSGINEDGEIAFKDCTCESRLLQLRDACRSKNPTAEIFISTHYDVADAICYGIQLPNLEPGRFLKAAQDPEKFARSVADFLNKYGLNGYDMDWEYGIDTNAMKKLLEALQKTLKGKGYKLTMASTTVIDDVEKYVDQINLMTYGRSIPDCGELNAKLIGGIITEGTSPESEEMIRGKCNYAVTYGYAGMFEWRLDNDHVKNGKPTYKGAEWLYKYMPVPIYRYHKDYPEKKWTCYNYSTSPMTPPAADWLLDCVAFFGAREKEQGATEVWQYYAEMSGSGKKAPRYCYVVEHVGTGWTKDKLAFYAFKEQQPHTVPVYQYHVVDEEGWWNLFYSTEECVPGWIKDGVIFYARK